MKRVEKSIRQGQRKRIEKWRRGEAERNREDMKKIQKICQGQDKMAFKIHLTREIGLLNCPVGLEAAIWWLHDVQKMMIQFCLKRNSVQTCPPYH